MEHSKLKGKHVVIGIPYYKETPPEFSMKVFKTARYLSSIGINCEVYHRRGALVYKQRNDISKYALGTNATHLMFIDTDMHFHQESIVRLLSHEKDIVGGIYIMRDGKKPLVYYRDYADTTGNFMGVMSTLYIPRKLHQVAGLGTGFMLIDMKVIRHMWQDEVAKKYGHPFNVWQTPFGNQIGEDLSFCHRATLCGFEVWADPVLRLGHQHSITVWSDLIHEDLCRGKHYCNDIEGWMTVTELNWLYDRAKTVGEIVEVGAWKGRTTHALLSACKGVVHAVDHFRGNVEDRKCAHKQAAEDPESVFQEFVHNVGKFRNLRLWRMSSLEAAEKFEDESVDMVFLDGGHTYEEVKQDIEAWFPKTRWIISGHDFDRDDVKKAVLECFPLDGEYDIRAYDTIWCVEKLENWDKLGTGIEEEENG